MEVLFQLPQEIQYVFQVLVQTAPWCPCSYNANFYPFDPGMGYTFDSVNFITQATSDTP